MIPTIEKIEHLAPDQSSLSSAAKIKAQAWQVLSRDSVPEFVWGECQGSGSTPYRVSLQLSDLGYKCSCPSRKFPCKHALSLMLLLARSPQAFGAADPPDWVTDWAARRKPGGSANKQAESGPRASLDEALAEPVKERSAESEARAAQQRERLKAQREETILAGLDELDIWIGDSLSRGLAHFMGEAAQRCRLLSQRLVDAKAPALAATVDALPGAIMALPEALRIDGLLEALGKLHLLACAYRRQDQLPLPLRHDIRRLVGWTIERQALLDDAEALHVTAVWTVIATVVEIQPDKLRRIETWLTGVKDGQRIPAVLIDYVPVTAAAVSSPFLEGETFVGELVYYPSAAPLRAIIVSRDGGTPPEVALPAQSLAAALSAYDGLCAAQPWLGHWPLTIDRPACRRFDGSGLWVVSGEEGIPLLPGLHDEALILASVELHSLIGLWDGRFFTPVMAETAIGRWLR